MRALLVVSVIIVTSLLLALPVRAATAAFLSLPLDGDPYISYYVYDAWTQRVGLPTYSTPLNGVQYGHSGTDYIVPQGTPVYAAAGGTVTTAVDGFKDGCSKNVNDGGGAGNNVWIKTPNGFFILYYHLQPGSVTQFVKVGQTVEAGQQIARTSNTGNTFGGPCGGFHLHFEVRDTSFNAANPYNTDTGYLFITNPPSRACAPAAAATSPSSTLTVEQKIALFWSRVDALQPTDCLSSSDLGQWALNVIARNPKARTTVADFKTSTAAMQTGLDRGGLALSAPPGSTTSANVEQRIADFWTRINALPLAGYVSAADLGQWALNVIDRNPRARLSTATFRDSTAAMQAAMDRAGLAP